ncbi:neutral amino acid transporter 9-like isoform X3 [Dromaius novaehollandiae]|uniref:neutral amino acid transporter 9-like isoform X3 n=1 Tax=Dromaius novaehollandiae TaxID=8790 RepID=UPI00311F0E42
MRAARSGRCPARVSALAPVLPVFAGRGGAGAAGQNNCLNLEEAFSSNMEEDAKPLLIPVGGDESNYGIMNIQFNPEDFKCKRPFHVEPTNIVSMNDDVQRVTDEASAMNKRIHYYSRLASPADRALIAPDHVLPAPDEIYVYSPLGTAFKIDSCTDGYGKNSSIVTIFMIWNTMMGTSILSIPWGIKQAGFTSGIILILLMGILTLYCCYRVVKSRKMIPLIDTSNWEFPDVCKYYFGSFGQWSSLLFSMVSLVGAMVVYWVLMSNFLFNTGKFIYNFVHDINVTEIVPGTNETNKVICPGAARDNPPQNGSVTSFSGNNTGFELFEEWWDKSRTVPFYLIAVLLPLLNLKSPSFFAKFNVLGTVSVVYLVFLVTVKAAHLGIHLEYNWFTENEFFVPEFRIRFPQLTGVLTLAFFIHNCIITLLQNNRNQENNMMTVYPLLGYLARVQLLGQVFGNVYPSVFHVLVLNIAIVGAGVAMARFYPNIGGIIRYSGATCGLAFVFVYPSLIYVISLHRAGQLTWPALIIHIFIILLGLANLVAQFLL